MHMDIICVHRRLLYNILSMFRFIGQVIRLVVNIGHGYSTSRTSTTFESPVHPQDVDEYFLRDPGKSCTLFSTDRYFNRTWVADSCIFTLSTLF